MQFLRKHIFSARFALAAASILFYIILILLLQAIAPAGANWKAEKNLIGCSAILFTLTMTLLGYSRRAWISFFAFLSLYLSVPLLETFVGLTVNGREMIFTASLATILWATISTVASLQNFLPRRFCLLLRVPTALLCLPLLLYPLLFWGYYALNHEFLTADALLAIFQTNPSEAAAYLAGFHPALPLSFAAVMIFLAAVSFVAVAPPPIYL